MTYAEFDKSYQAAVAAFRKKWRDKETEFVLRAIDRANGNVSQAARDLGVTDAHVHNRIRALAIRERLAVVRAHVGR